MIRKKLSGQRAFSPDMPGHPGQRGVMMAKIRPGGHGGYHPIGFEGREDTSKRFSFTCTGFKEAMDAATEEMIGDVNAAIRRTLNTVAGSAVVTASTEIRKIYNVPANVLKDRIDLFMARMNDLEAVIEIGGRSVSLSYFSAKQFNKNVVTTRKGSMNRKRISKFQGVQVEVIRGRRTELKSAFMRTFRSGHVGVLRRTSKSRYPIEVKSAISIASMFEKPAVNAAVVARIDADLERVFWHEFDQFVNRGVGR